MPRPCHQAGWDSPRVPGCGESLHPPQPASHSPSGGAAPQAQGVTPVPGILPQTLWGPPSVPTVSPCPGCACWGVQGGLPPNTPQRGCGWRTRAMAAVITLGCWGFRDLEHQFSSFLLFFCQLCYSSTHPLVTTQATSGEGARAVPELSQKHARIVLSVPGSAILPKLFIALCSSQRSAAPRAHRGLSCAQPSPKASAQCSL